MPDRPLSHTGQGHKFACGGANINAFQSIDLIPFMFRKLYSDFDFIRAILKNLHQIAIKGRAQLLANIGDRQAHYFTGGPETVDQLFLAIRHIIIHPINAVDTS